MRPLSSLGRSAVRAGVCRSPIHRPLRTRRHPRAPKPLRPGVLGGLGPALPAALLLGALALLAIPPAAGAAASESAARIQALYETPLLDGDAFDPGVPRPGEILGYPVGSRPATHREIVQVFEALAASSPAAELREHGATHEQRRLIHLIVSSPRTIARLDSVQADVQRLADPRGLTGPTQRALVDRMPAVCWLGYSIHGDELSGADAAMLVAYRMVAGTDSLTRALRERLVVIIDPMENPDGRDRYITMTGQWAGVRPNPDLQSLQHAGFWPWGRTNHYLFDLNRDWFALVHPESRGRAAAIVSWQPQLLVDAHEMGSFDTFLFSPPREPFNPNMTASVQKWWSVYADDTAAAFDEHGWSYYTEAWHEEWYPGYGSSWSCYLGAVGMLYEQARVSGSVVKRPDSSYLTYPETVHHQYVASIANLETTARHRRALLADFVGEKRRATGAQGAFLFIEGDTPGRARRLAEVLEAQGIEVLRARRPIRAAGIPGTHDARGRSLAQLGIDELPIGTYVVNLDQPMSPLARVILEIDPRMPTSFLETELHELQKRKQSRLYEVTSWSMLTGSGLEAYESPVLVRGPLRRYEPEGTTAGKVQNPGARFGYLIDWRSDAAAPALVCLLERGLLVRAARKDFTIDERDYVRGSLLLRRADNPDDLDAIVAEVARGTGVTVIGTDSALSDDGPDLGGGDFRRLREPRVAVVAGYPVSYGSLGPLWHLLDKRFEARVSLLDLARLGQYDLSKYNVLVLPSLWGSGENFTRGLGPGGLDGLRDWIQAGGTLIAMGTGAEFVASADNELSQVRLKRHVLEELDAYDASLEDELLALGTPEIDSLAVWGGRGTVVVDGAGVKDDEEDDDDADGEGDDADDAEEDDDDADGDDDNDENGRGDNGARLTEAQRERLDQLQRLMRPSGATLLAELDPEHWLTAGMGDWIPINYSGSRAFMSKEPVVTPARFAAEEELRIGGLLWPEARQRWARTAYLTREGKGRGQIILFAGVPNLRAYWYGPERLLINALLLGPGMGASAPAPW